MPPHPRNTALLRELTTIVPYLGLIRAGYFLGGGVTLGGFTLDCHEPNHLHDSMTPNSSSNSSMDETNVSSLLRAASEFFVAARFFVCALTRARRHINKLINKKQHNNMSRKKKQV